MTDDRNSPHARPSNPPVTPSAAKPSPHSKPHDPVSQFLHKSGPTDPDQRPEPRAHPAPSPGPDLTDAPTLPGYQITARLGEGGMGVVWAGIQLSTKRKVAIKFLSAASFGSSRAKARFVREVELAASLQHPNIARVYDSGLEKGVWYYAMELVEGVPLDTFVKENHLSLVEILKLMQGVCEGMQHAHQKGVIHRDLKPSNILVSKDGQAHILDFGLAKDIAHDAAEAVTQQGDVSGTPAYMSPEQADGKASSVDTRTDVYSLGVILYTLLTRKTPHDLTGSHVSVIRRIAEEEVIRPRTAMPGLDHDLEALLLKALARKPEERYPSAADLAGDIANYLTGDPLTARPATTAYFLSKRLKKYRLPVTAAAVVAGLLLGTAIWSYIDVSAAKVRADNEAAAAKVAKADAEHALKAYQDREQAILEATNQASQKTAEASAEKAAADLARQRAIDEQNKATEARAQVTEVSSSLKSTQIDLSAAQESALAAGKQAVLNLADSYTIRGLSPDSSFTGSAALWFSLAALQAAEDPLRQQVNMIRYNNWTQSQFEPIAGLALPPDPSAKITQSERGRNLLSFNPITARYLISAQNGVTQIWDVATELAIKLPEPIGRLTAAAWLPDGKSVVVGGQSGLLALLSFPACQITQRWTTGAPVTSVAAGFDGKYLAAASAKRVVVAKAAGGEALFLNETTDVRCVEFSPLGLLAAVTADQTVRVFSLADSGTTLRAQVKLAPVRHLYDEEFIIAPQFVNGGLFLLTVQDRGFNGAPGVLAWYDLDAGRELTPTTTIPGSNGTAVIWGLTPTPDGKSVILSGPNGYFIDPINRKLGTKIDQNYCVAVNRQQNRLAMGLMDRFTVFGLTPGKKGGAANFDVRLPAGTQKLAYSNDGNFFAASSGGLVRVWKVPPRERPIVRNIPVPIPNFAAFSSDAKHIVSIGMAEDNAKVRSLQVFSGDTGQPEGSPIDLGEVLMSAAFSPDAIRIAAATGLANEPHRLRFFDWARSAETAPAFTLPSQPEWIAYAPDGNAVAVHCTDGQVIIVDAASGAQLARLQARPFKQGYYYASSYTGTVAFAADGKSVVTLGSPKFQVWDRATSKERFSIDHQSDVWSFAESPDGRLLATGSFDGYVHVVDAATGKDRYPPLHHPREVGYIAFSPDGKTLCSTSMDNHIRIWETASGKLLTVFSTEERHRRVAFTPDGRWIVTDAPVHVWDAKSGFAISPVLSTGYHSYVDVSSDGRRAVISGILDSARLIDLTQLTVQATIPPQQAATWSELVSSSEVLGSNLVALDNIDWIDRCGAYWKTYPRNAAIAFSENAPAAPPPPPIPLVLSHGAVGVGTWATNAQYRDIKVLAPNKTLLQSDFSRGTENWQLRGGSWKADNGTLHQTANATDCRAISGDAAWTDYVLTLQAQKISGNEGFLVMFHVQDQSNFLWWDIGGWNNTRSVIEKSIKGAKSELGPASNIKVDANRWYDIRIEVRGNDIKCFLDGKLITETTDPGSPGPAALPARAQ